ncbi:MAG: F0F1 ATP synthase subunit gamma [Alphaproteobacteria bacterium]
MPSLKALRNRITSVRSTRRITSAMKMVSAAKLRRAQELALEARPYAERMEKMLSSVAGRAASAGNAPPLLAGSGKSDVHLLVPIFTDRGLCGGFNSSIARWTRNQIRALQAEGKTVRLLIVGRKGQGMLRRDYASLIVDVLEDTARPMPKFDTAAQIAQRLTSMFAAGEFDVATIVYNRFISALTQKVTPQQLIPFAVPAAEGGEEAAGATALHEYEPDETEILAALLPRNMSVQVFRAMLESFASEQGARMTAMDSATRNAGDMIDRLTMNYNRSRQAAITKELIEIISGAEAL